MFVQLILELFSSFSILRSSFQNHTPSALEPSSLMAVNIARVLAFTGGLLGALLALGYHDFLEPMEDKKYGLLLAIEAGLVVVGFCWYLHWHTQMERQQKLRKRAPLLAMLKKKKKKGKQQGGMGSGTELLPVKPAGKAKGRASMTATTNESAVVALASHSSMTTI